MKRLFGAAALIGGLGLSVLAQDPLDAPVRDDEAITPSPDAPAVDTDDATDDPLDADALDAPDWNRNSVVEPQDPSPEEGLGTPPPDPLAPEGETAQEPLPRDPAEPQPGRRPSARAIDQPLTDPEGALDESPTRPDGLDATPPGQAPAPGSTIPRDTRGDGLGAPPIDEPSADPRREPIERQPLPPDPALSEPLQPEREIAPPATSRTPPPDTFDPAYGAPAPPRRNQPQVEIGEVVRNPVRIHDARLLVMMGHSDAAIDAIDTLGERFPTDARVPYLRFFTLSRMGQRDAALDALQQALSLEQLYPVTDYNRFMEPLQGPERFYVERVRQAAAELAATDSLVEPTQEEVLPPQREEPNESRPLPRQLPDSLPQDVEPVEPEA